MRVTPRAWTVGWMLVLLALGAAAPGGAGSPEKKQASDEMKWGLDAARRGYWLEALSRFQRANQLLPEQPNILNNIAVALEASGRFEDALLAYETAMSIAPNDRVLRRNYAQFKEFYDANVAPIPPGKEPDQSAEDEPTSDQPTEGAQPEAQGSGDDDQTSR